MNSHMSFSLEVTCFWGLSILNMSKAYSTPRRRDAQWFSGDVWLGKWIEGLLLQQTGEVHVGVAWCTWGFKFSHWIHRLASQFLVSQLFHPTWSTHETCPLVGSCWPTKKKQGSREMCEQTLQKSVSLVLSVLTCGDSVKITFRY